jgi:hypothetical protein
MKNQTIIVRNLVQRGLLPADVNIAAKALTGYPALVRDRLLRCGEAFQSGFGLSAGLPTRLFVSRNGYVFSDWG